MKFGSVVQEMSFTDISYLELMWPFCSVERNHLCNFGKGLYEEQFFAIIKNLDQWFRRRCLFKDISYLEGVCVCGGGGGSDIFFGISSKICPTPSQITFIQCN